MLSELKELSKAVVYVHSDLGETSDEAVKADLERSLLNANIKFSACDVSISSRKSDANKTIYKYVIEGAIAELHIIQQSITANNNIYRRSQIGLVFPNGISEDFQKKHPTLGDFILSTSSFLRRHPWSLGISFIGLVVGAIALGVKVSFGWAIGLGVPALVELAGALFYNKTLATQAKTVCVNIQSSSRKQKSDKTKEVQVLVELAPPSSQYTVQPITRVDIGIEVVKDTKSVGNEESAVDAKDERIKMDANDEAAIISTFQTMLKETREQFGQLNRENFKGPLGRSRLLAPLPNRGNTNAAAQALELPNMPPSSVDNHAPPTLTPL